MISQHLLDFASAGTQSEISRQGRVEQPGSAPDPLLRVAYLKGGAHVAIDATAADGDGAALLAQLEALGLKNGAAWQDVVSGYLPQTAIGALEDLPMLATALPVSMAGAFRLGRYAV